MLLQAAKVTYWLNVTYLLAMGFTKASICMTLLRINKGSSQRKVTWALWLIMVAIVMSTLGAFLTFVIRCKTSGTCQDSNRTIAILDWIGIAVFIALDIALAIVPVFIIRALKMRKSLKLSTGVILGLGGIACLAAILRIPSQLQAVGQDGANELYKIGAFILWSVAETGLGIIASCLPMLRKLLRSFDAEKPSVIPAKQVYYSAPKSGHSGQTPINNMERLPYDSYLIPEQQLKGDWTQTSYSSDGTSLALHPTYSSTTAVAPSPAKAQTKWTSSNSTASPRDFVMPTRDVDQMYLYGQVS